MKLIDLFVAFGKTGFHPKKLETLTGSPRTKVSIILAYHTAIMFLLMHADRQKHDENVYRWPTRTEARECAIG